MTSPRLGRTPSCALPKLELASSGLTSRRAPTDLPRRERKQFRAFHAAPDRAQSKGGESILDPRTADQFLEFQPARKSRTSSPLRHSFAGVCWRSAASLALTASTSTFDQLTDEISISPLGSM
jgi:hypothetical protein